MTTPARDQLAQVTDELGHHLREFANAARQSLRMRLSAMPGEPLGAETFDAKGRSVLVVVHGHGGAGRGFASQRGQADVKVYRYGVDAGAQGSQPHIEPLATLQAHEAFALATDAISGPALKRCVDRYVRQASEAALGQEIYTDLVAQINHINASGNPVDAIKAVERIGVDAQVRGEILGRHITSSAGDGYAYYLVTDATKDKVRLQHLPVMDGYTDEHFGHDAWVQRDFVEAQLKSAEKIESLRSRRHGF